MAICEFDDALCVVMHGIVARSVSRYISGSADRLRESLEPAGRDHIGYGELLVTWRRVRFPASADEFVIRADEVYVWRASLVPPAVYFPGLWHALDSVERSRADRFVFDRHRLRYVAAHGLLRHLLGGYLRIDPAAVRFGRARHGKPFLAAGSNVAPDTPLRFNLSHSGELALIAVSVDREVGVDLERIRGERDVVGIASHFFSAAEVEALTALPADRRVAAFYRCWTRKEAYLKACGAGLAMRLDSFDVSLDPGAPALLRSESGVDEPRRWKMVELAADVGFDAALAVEGDGWRLVANSLDFQPSA